MTQSISFNSTSIDIKCSFIVKSVLFLSCLQLVQFFLALLKLVLSFKAPIASFIHFCISMWMKTFPEMIPHVRALDSQSTKT